jgi:hypothetical protein
VVTFRVPSAGDLAALGRAEAAGDLERWLVDRCLIEVLAPGDAPDALPETVVDALGEAMLEADPQAEVELSLTCPDCAHGWNAAFDVVAFLWQEIEARAPRILGEVDTLAARFGWSERAILQLSPWRRQRYLELAAELP